MVAPKLLYGVSNNDIDVLAFLKIAKAGEIAFSTNVFFLLHHYSVASVRSELWKTGSRKMGSMHGVKQNLKISVLK